MVGNEYDFNYYDAVEATIIKNTRLKISEMNEEFKHWLMLNNCIYLQEAGNDSSSWYIQYKNKKSNDIKEDIAKVKEYAIKQAASDAGWLQRYRKVILNPRKFPIKSQGNMQTPNYQLAIQRISTPLSTALNGIDLAKIDAENEDNRNFWLKHFLIPAYNGNGQFIQFAKAYYYGAEGKKVTMNANQLTAMMKTMFQFCTNFMARIQSCETDAHGIINYINKDPNTGQIQQTTQSDLKMLNQAKYASNQLNSKASTNPNANIGVQRAVNADTNFEIFMQDYFSDILNEDQPIQQPQQQMGQQQAPQQNQQQVSANTNQKSQVVPQNNNQNPNGTPVDSAALAYKKKQVACDIIKDAFAAKLSAIGLLYHDFIYILRSHVTSYKGGTKGNKGQEIHKQSRLEKQQAAQQQQNQQQR